MCLCEYVCVCMWVQVRIHLCGVYVTRHVSISPVTEVMKKCNRIQLYVCAWVYACVGVYMCGVNDIVRILPFFTRTLTLSLYLPLSHTHTYTHMCWANNQFSLSINTTTTNGTPHRMSSNWHTCVYWCTEVRVLCGMCVCVFVHVLHDNIHIHSWVQERCHCT